ncbi:hypothetical protein, partial [Arachnia propionica]|uniref:hypothetical protein n=1 Tax=Arachnia propionica TaxID=1750 RepID=UPI00163B19E8
VKLLEPLPDAAEVLAQGLTHEHVDVQRAVVASLKRLGREDLADAGGLSPVVAAEIGVEMNPTETRQATAVVDRPARPVVPFTDEDALERVAALVEDGGDPVELELALAWFAGTESPGERLAPLRKRVKGALTPLLQAAFNLPPEVGAEPWPFGEVPAVPSSVAQALWHQRIAEVAAVVAGKEPRRPLLATPSDSHGFVEGSAFLDRLSQARASLGDGVDLRLRCPGDLVQAGFRLTEPDRLRAEQVLGFSLPGPSSRLNVVWVGKESDERKPNGEPEVTWWRARMSCEPEPTEPHPVEGWNHLNGDVLPFALVDPSSTAYLVAATIETAMFGVTDFPSQVPRALRFLREQNGRWAPETAQLLALAMSAQRAETRTLAAELLAESIPGRLGAAETAEGMAATVMLCKVNRWASSLSDAASINAGSVIDLLTALLPRLDPGLRGIGGLMQLLLDEQLRVGRLTEDETLREWLAGFTGSSAAARCAKALLAAVP